LKLSALVAEDFASGGTLARRWPQFRRRPQQAEMAAAIADAFEHGDRLLVEAATGAGKTLAYLVPALRFSGRVLISTHTRALQDQLWLKDLPQVMQALGLRRKVALLKGRTNYYCPYRVERRLRQGAPADQARLLLRLRAWFAESADGDLAAAPFDVEAAGIASAATATAEQCLGSQCPSRSICPLLKARQRAQQADIVIVNHSLLLADAVLKAKGWGDLLPPFDAYVLDEAHALADVATRAFGASMSRRRFLVWRQDLAEELALLGDEEKALQEASQIVAATTEAWQAGKLEEVQAHWQKALQLVERLAERNEGLLRLAERAAEIASLLEAMQNPPTGTIVWIEERAQDRVVHLAPVEPAAELERRLWGQPAAFVLLSATLRVQQSFAFARRRLGLADAKELVVRSPFDFRRQMLIYIPHKLPERRDDPELSALADEIEQLVRCAEGRAFVLFTSYWALRKVAARLRERLPWSVLVQGEEMARDALLAQFRRDVHSVLCATRSFWEGVDVPGDALSLVVIDKAPFPPPEDPLIKARARKIEEAGGSSFHELMLPEAAIVLRQGVGRLIRSETDRGVVALLDARLLHRSYGKRLLAELPDAPITHDLAEVKAFFAACC